MPGGTAVTLAIESIKAPINKAVPPPRIKATFSPPRQLNSKNITAKDRILRHSIDRIPLSSSNSSEFIKDDKVLRQSNDLPLVAYKAPVTKREKNNIINENYNSDKSITSKKLPEILFKPIPKVKGVYRYRLMPGNNVRAVLSALRVRPWWHPASKSDDDDVSSAAAQAAFPSFIWEQYRCPKRYKDDTYKDTILNHLNNNNCLVSKKGLYFSLKIYCAKEGINLLDIVPRTFYLSPSGLKSTVGNEPDDLKEFMDFVATKKKSPTVCNDGFKEEKDNVFDSAALDSPTTRSISSVEVESIMKVPILAIEKSENDLIWILKPARLTNRGYGIQVVKGTTEVLDVVNKTITSRASTADGDTEEKLSEKEATEKKIGILTKIANKNGAKEGWIVQEYMERPLLVNGRKFDIRCFVLLTHCRSKGLKAYFFNQAYVRTSCRKYNLENLDDRETHLTNDAVQKHSKEYGKFESGNKLNFVEWQESINRDYPGTDTTIVESKIRPEIIRLTTISIKSVAEELNSSNGIVKNTFELLGYDYMVTDKFEPKLIEINSNPCLEFACPLLKEIISNVINSTIKYAVDPILKPPPAGSRTKLCEEAVSLLEQEEERFQQIFP